MSSRQQVVQLAIGAGALIGIGVALMIVRMVIGNPMSANLLGAIVVALIAGRVGLALDDFTPLARARMIKGGTGPLVLVLIVVVVALAAGATIDFVPPTGTTLFGIAEGFALAYTAELWLHAVPLHFAKKAGVPLRYAYPYAVLAGMAPLLLIGGFEPTSLVLGAASGAFFVALWVRSKDAWAPIAAHAVWAWSIDSLLVGDLFDLSSAAGRLIHGAGSTGLIAWVAAAGFVALTLLVLLNKLTFLHANP